MFYLETNFVPNNKEQKLIDFVSTNEFAWYYQKSTSEKYMSFCHGLLRRNDKGTEKEGIVNSDLYLDFKNIFLKICEQNNVKVNTIFRAAVNLTHNYPDKMGEIHIDHNFSHKQFIWYLNDFTDAPTYIFDEQENLIKTTSVGKNKVVIFDNKKHAQGFCQPYERRAVVVFTFN